MSTYMTATEARKKFYSVIDSTGNTGMPVVITHGGLPKVVLMSFDEFEGWQETMEIMADPTLSQNLKDQFAQLKNGTLETVDVETLRQNSHS